MFKLPAAHDPPRQLVAAIQLQHVLREGADPVAIGATGRVQEVRRSVWKVQRAVLNRQAAGELPTVAVALGDRDVDAVIHLVIRVGHRDGAGRRGPHRPLADDVVFTGVAGGRIRVRQRPLVDVGQGKTWRTRLKAEWVRARQATVVLPVDVVHSDREVWHQLVLHPDDPFTRPSELRVRIDGVTGWRQDTRCRIEAGATRCRHAGQLVALDEAVLVRIRPTRRARYTCRYWRWTRM